MYQTDTHEKRGGKKKEKKLIPQKTSNWVKKKKKHLSFFSCVSPRRVFFFLCFKFPNFFQFLRKKKQRTDLPIVSEHSLRGERKKKRKEMITSLYIDSMPHMSYVRLCLLFYFYFFLIFFSSIFLSLLNIVGMYDCKTSHSYAPPSYCPINPSPPSSLLLLCCISNTFL